MTVTAIDTHAVVKQLLAAGFTDQQAEAVTRVVREAQNVDLSALATKADLQAGLVATKADLEKSIAETKSDIIKWVVGMIGFQTVATIGAVLALARVLAH